MCVHNCLSVCVRVCVHVRVCVGKYGINQSSAVIVGLIVRRVPAGPRGLGVRNLCARVRARGTARRNKEVRE